MNVLRSPSASRTWSLYVTYVRLVVCVLLLPLLVTGMVLVPEARSDFVATIIIITCCIYIDTDTVTRHFRANPKGAR